MEIEIIITQSRNKEMEIENMYTKPNKENEYKIYCYRNNIVTLYFIIKREASVTDYDFFSEVRGWWKNELETNSIYGKLGGELEFNDVSESDCDFEYSDDPQSKEQEGFVFEIEDLKYYGYWANSVWKVGPRIWEDFNMRGLEKLLRRRF